MHVAFLATEEQVLATEGVIMVMAVATAIVNMPTMDHKGLAQAAQGHRDVAAVVEWMATCSHITFNNLGYGRYCLVYFSS